MTIVGRLATADDVTHDGRGGSCGRLDSYYVIIKELSANTGDRTKQLLANIETSIMLRRYIDETYTIHSFIIDL